MNIPNVVGPNQENAAITPPDEERVAKLFNEQSTTIQKLIRQALFLAQGPETNKMGRMMSLAETLSETITPYTVCANKCNHCCYMPVAITSYEAELITPLVGRQPLPVGTGYVEFADKPFSNKYVGVACTFLKAGTCSIYPVRPIACRTHFNLAKDEENCKVVHVNEKTGKTLPTTPNINFAAFWAAQAAISMDAGYTYADIRDFFPEE